VRVSLGGEPSNVSPTELNVLTGFELSRALEFTGNCEAFEAASPCETRLELELERAADSVPNSVTSVAWSIHLEGKVYRNEGPDRGPFPLSWDVEISRP
jgi:hypothetical protein